MLIKRAIPREKLIAKGYGSKASIASNDSGEGRQENRRRAFVEAFAADPTQVADPAPPSSALGARPGRIVRIDLIGGRVASDINRNGQGG